MIGLPRRSVTSLILLAAASGLAAADELPLVIQGYDPVAYFLDGRPVRGLPEIAYDWDEYRYRFSSAAHRDFFKADPVRYAPQFANFCALALSRGEIMDANPAYWLINDGKLYLFGKPNGPALFSQALARHIAQATENKPLIQSR